MFKPFYIIIKYWELGRNQLAQVTSTSRELAKKLSKMYNFFNNRIMSHWKALKDTIIYVERITSFKNQLNNH